MTQSITREQDRPTAEIIGICLLCFGWFTLGSLMSVMSSTSVPGPSGQGGSGSVQFSAAGFVSVIIYELIFGGLALFILSRRGYAPASLLPKPSTQGAMVGVPLYIVTALLAWIVANAVIDRSTAQPVVEMMPSSPIPLPLVVVLGMVNGLYEETFLLGYLQRAFERHSTTVAIGVSVLVRLLYHLYQGPAGAASILVYGTLLGLFHARTKWLWPVVVAHALADIVPFL